MNPQQQSDNQEASTPSETRNIGEGATEKPIAKDLIEGITGPWGKYQLLLCLLLFLSKFPVAFHQLAILFLAPKVKYICPDTNKETCPCANPEFDRSIFKRTMIMEWNLICDRRWLFSFNQALFQLGTLIGSIVFGMAADRYGRRLPLLVAVVTQISTGASAAYIPDYWAFSFLRFLVGVATGGTMVTTFVIVMEFVGTQYRDVISALYQTPFNLGHMMLPAIAYILNDFSQFQLTISILSSAQLLYFCFVPDTPRWLIAMKRTDEAVYILERVAKMNNNRSDQIRDDVEAYQLAAEKRNLKKGNILDLFRTPNLRKNILAISYNWLSCSYCFYGVSQYLGHLGGDVFVNVAACASVTLLGSLASIPLLRYIGRRNIVIISNFICAFCLLLLAAIPEGIGSVICASVGVVASFIVFVVVYLYCTELFPTVVRNAALGFSSMMARVGSMIAPFIIELKYTASWAPPIAFALMPLIAGGVTFFLPETKDHHLMTTLEEGEDFGKKVTNNQNVV